MIRRTSLPFAALALLCGFAVTQPAAAQQPLDDHADPTLVEKPDYLSDSALNAQVRTALIAETGLDSMKIEVETRDGVVTLSGEVPDRASSARAVHVAQQVAGVREVQNELEARAPS